MRGVTCRRHTVSICDLDTCALSDADPYPGTASARKSEGWIGTARAASSSFRTRGYCCCWSPISITRDPWGRGLVNPPRASAPWSGGLPHGNDQVVLQVVCRIDVSRRRAEGVSCGCACCAVHQLLLLSPLLPLLILKHGEPILDATSRPRSRKGRSRGRCWALIRDPRSESRRECGIAERTFLCRAMTRVIVCAAVGGSEGGSAPPSRSSPDPHGGAHCPLGGARLSNLPDLPGSCHQFSLSDVPTPSWILLQISDNGDHQPPSKEGKAVSVRSVAAPRGRLVR